MGLKEICKYIAENYIAIIVTAVFCIIIYPRLKKITGALFRKLKKIKAGPSGIEIETHDGIDPNTPCPYIKARDEAFNELRNVKKIIDKLSSEVDRNWELLKNVYIDQQKQLFYDTDQPDLERIAGGLNYVYMGGNSETKPKVIEFAKEHPDIYNGLVYKKPHLRLW